MAGYRTLAQLLGELYRGSRAARVLRFVYRHPKAKNHRKIIGLLRRRTQRLQRRARLRFEAMQRSNYANSPTEGR